MPASSRGAPSELDAAIPVAFPLRGEWRAATTPARMIPSHGTDMLAQRYAYDLLRVDERESIHPASKLRQYLLGVPTRGVGLAQRALALQVEGHVQDGLDFLFREVQIADQVTIA